jgi:hypothetical protein
MFLILSTLKPMNRALSLSISFILIFFFACNRKSSNPQDDILEVNKQIITLGGKSTNDTVRITSSSTWVFSISQNVSWLTITSSSGTGNDYIVITAKEENSGSARTVDVNIATVSGSKSIAVHVTQPTTDFSSMAVFGGENNDNFNGFIETPQGEFIAVGQTISKGGDIPDNQAGESRLWVAKFDEKGVVKWSKVFGHGNGISIAKRSAGGYMILADAILEQATVSDALADIDAWLIGIDEDGNVQWENLIGGSGTDELRSIKQLSDGNFILGGSTTSDDHDVSVNNGSQQAWVVKIDGQGEIIWEKTHDDSGFSAFTDVTPISSGGFAFCGWHLFGTAPSRTSGWYGKLDDDGNIIRTEKVFEPSSLNTIFEADNGDFILAGSDNFLGYYYREAALMRLDPAGNLKWSKTYGGTGDDVVHSAIETSDQRLIIVGVTNSNDRDFSENAYETAAMLIETDSEGTLVKTKTVGGEGDDYAHHVSETSSGKLAFVGMTKSFKHKYDNLANLANGWFVISDF